MTLTNVGTRYNGMEAVAWKGGSFFQYNNSKTQQAAPPPCPSPVGRGVITEIPLSISELVVTTRREVRGKDEEIPHKGWKLEDKKG